MVPICRRPKRRVPPATCSRTASNAPGLQGDRSDPCRQPLSINPLVQSSRSSPPSASRRPFQLATALGINRPAGCMHVLIVRAMLFAPYDPDNATTALDYASNRAQQH